MINEIKKAIQKLNLDKELERRLGVVCKMIIDCKIDFMQLDDFIIQQRTSVEGTKEFEIIVIKDSVKVSSDLIEDEITKVQPFENMIQKAIEEENYELANILTKWNNKDI